MTTRSIRRPLFRTLLATGLVALLMLTAVVLLGILVNRAGRLPGLPRFAVTGLHRIRGGWQIERNSGLWPGRFDQVVLALPPAQAAPLLRPHATGWSEAAAQVPMQACWTLMAVTDTPPGPAFDLLQPTRGPLASIVRNDRKPGRQATPGHAVWVAQASAAWSASHLEDHPAGVSEALRDALRAAINPGGEVRWCHSTVHRWLYARPARVPLGTPGCWWRIRWARP